MCCSCTSRAHQEVFEEVNCFFVVVGFCSSWSGFCPSHAKGASGIDLLGFIHGGRFTYDDSLVAHGCQQYKLKCTFHAKRVKSRIVGDAQMSRFEPVEPQAHLAVWHLRSQSLETKRLHLRLQPTADPLQDWLVTHGDMYCREPRRIASRNRVAFEVERIRKLDT